MTKYIAYQQHIVVYSLRFEADTEEEADRILQDSYVPEDYDIEKDFYTAPRLMKQCTEEARDDEDIQ